MTHVEPVAFSLPERRRFLRRGRRLRAVREWGALALVGVAAVWAAALTAIALVAR